MEVTQPTAAQQQQQQKPSSSVPSGALTGSPSSTSPRRKTLSRHNSQNLSLDLSDLPPLIPPSPPSNTLLITNLMDPSIFHPASLATIRENISRTADLYSFAPLKSFRRIVASFYSTDDAISIRQQLDGTNILGARVRVFFGADTPVDLESRDRHLQAPASAKLFFISPPPSPPHGWEMRNEDPPNKDVHADDLAAALAKLHAKTSQLPEPGEEPEEEEDKAHQQQRHAAVQYRSSVKDDDEMQDEVTQMVSPISPARTDTDAMVGVSKQQQQHGRMRSGSTTIVYHPDHHGDSPGLPAVMVEDTTASQADEDEDEGPENGGEKKIMAHTSRPPVELMDQS